jgi:hypothetical protein
MVHANDERRRRATEEMATCPRCRKPVAYKWERGFVSEPHNVLVADSVFHAECWDAQIAEHPPFA